MIAEAKYSLSKSYYEEHYTQWLKHISQWRRFIPLIDVIFITIGFVLTLWSVRFAVVGLVAIVIGVAELISIPRHRTRWMSSRLGDKNLDYEISVRFFEDRVEIVGPFSRGEVLWEAFERLVETEKGLFIKQQKGLSIYVPKSAITPANTVQELIRSHLARR